MTVRRVDDDCNWFDEWLQDRKELGITDDMFYCSPDDACPSFMSEQTKALFLSMREKYARCAALTPKTYTATVKNGKIELSVNLPAQAVAFFEIRPL